MTNIVLCGGSGTRLWPISRTLMPKQFVKLFDNKSLFQLTVERNSKICSKNFIVSNTEQYFLALDQLEELTTQNSQPATNYLLEPVGRNTAPAIALACMALGRDEIVLVTPSDHLIKDEVAYEKVIQKAKKLASENNLVTFGITPTFAETGFGYIEAELQSAERLALSVKKFHEKPDLKKAQEYLKAGNYYWNSGMFMFKAGVFLEELEKYSPEIYDACKVALEKTLGLEELRGSEQSCLEQVRGSNASSSCLEKVRGSNATRNPEVLRGLRLSCHTRLEQVRGSEQSCLEQVRGSEQSRLKQIRGFEQSLEANMIRIKHEDMLNIPEDSIDYAVMEKSEKVKVVPSDIAWSDVGSFDSLYEELQKDENGNTKNKNHISIDSKNNLIYADERKIATIDIQDCIIVDTGDALLVSKKGSSQKVKEIVSKLKEESSELPNIHLTGYRPWGTYTILEDSNGYKIKRIEVKPGKRLSLQKHFHRNEHWIVVSGCATVTVDDKTFILNPNESTYIKAGQLHRLSNEGKLPLIIIEAQVGEYTGEDDIVRIDDDFSRN